jgi:hypothetical protein
MRKSQDVVASFVPYHDHAASHPLTGAAELRMTKLCHRAFSDEHRVIEMLNSVWRKAMLRSYDLDLVFVHTGTP